MHSLTRPRRLDAARAAAETANAAATLISLMTSGNPAAIRLATARSVLDYAIKSVEPEDITARLDALEVRNAEKH